MPGDVIRIDQSHRLRAGVAWPHVLARLESRSPARSVVAVYGGSGVGKSEVASLLAAYARAAGFPAYVMSGDNYPRRYPKQNDAERLNRFRSAGLAAMAQHPDFADAWDEALHHLWPEFFDADARRAEAVPVLAEYQDAGRGALEAYLGTDDEIDFSLVNSIIRRFKEGAPKLSLKRMGRKPEDIHFRSVDFANTPLLFLEWTHGNNPRVDGIDFALFLYSSPEQTLAHRRRRARDKGTDSHFTRLVLDIEQRIVNAGADRADLILSLDGEILQPSDVDRRGI